MDRHEQRRCIHGRTEKQACAKCNEMDRAGGVTLAPAAKTTAGVIVHLAADRSRFGTLGRLGIR